MQGILHYYFDIFCEKYHVHRLILLKKSFTNEFFNPLNATDVYIRAKLVTQQPWTYIYYVLTKAFFLLPAHLQVLLWSLKEVAFFSFF